MSLLGSMKWLLHLSVVLTSRITGHAPSLIQASGCMRFPSLSGAQGQEPSNGMGLLKPTVLLQHRQFVGQFSTWLSLGP